MAYAAAAINVCGESYLIVPVLAALTALKGVCC